VRPSALLGCARNEADFRTLAASESTMLIREGRCGETAWTRSNRGMTDMFTIAFRCLSLRIQKERASMCRPEGKVNLEACGEALSDSATDLRARCAFAQPFT